MIIRQELKTNLKELNRFIDAIEHCDLNEMRVSCVTCTYFSRDERELCLLCGKRPPARVIAFGCGSYSDELEVPF